MDGRSGLDGAFDERDQAVLGNVVDASQPNSPETLGLLDLDRDRDDRLGVGLPAEHAPFNATQVCLVDLDPAGQTLAAGADHRAAVAVQHRPRRLVGAQPERPLDPQRGDAVLLARHLPRRREPQPQRRPSAMKNRSRRDRRLPTTDLTLPPTAAQPPARPTDTPRAPEPLGPAQPL